MTRELILIKHEVVLHLSSLPRILTGRMQLAGPLWMLSEWWILGGTVCLKWHALFAASKINIHFSNLVSREALKALIYSSHSFSLAASAKHKAQHGLYHLIHAPTLVQISFGQPHRKAEFVSSHSSKHYTFLIYLSQYRYGSLT